MILYHYRSIKNAIKEIHGTFHFSARHELNDPSEFFTRIFWQSDKAAWEGLFRNYVCSVYQAITWYLLKGNEELLQHRTLIEDLHRFDDVPLGGILKELGDSFLEDEEVRNIAAYYGNDKLKVSADELRFILRFIHRRALVLCINKFCENRIIPENEKDDLLKAFSSYGEPKYPFDLIDKDVLDPKDRECIVKAAETVFEDMIELRYIKLGFDDDSFLYRNSGNQEDSQKTEKTKARLHRNWLTVAVDFPEIYVEQLQSLVFPENYVVCFSGKNDDSSMWGVYADNHRGVCLIFDTDEGNCLSVTVDEHQIILPVRKVIYGCKTAERNFFESLGRFTLSQAETWLSGVDFKSASLSVLKNVAEWRDSYWEDFKTVGYRKMSAWQHEDEYRISVSDSIYSFETTESRNLRYSPKALKGVIFGAKTSEYDKKLIMESLLKHADDYTNFTFYQEECNDNDLTITVREKTAWHL